MKDYQAPKGYRLLRTGEIIRRSDLVLINDLYRPGSQRRWRRQANADDFSRTFIGERYYRGLNSLRARRRS